MITYLTGVPGSGKTLRVMYLLRQDMYAGRQVYSNIQGDSQGHLPVGHLPLPSDWTTLPDGSVVVVDEAQHRWPQTGPGKPLLAEVSALDEHRHRGFDFILTTQRVTGISHHVRGLVGLHEHLQRRFGASFCTIWRMGQVFDPSDYNQRRGCDSEVWKFPKDLYGSYQSSVQHTGAYRFKLPKKARLMIAAAIVFVPLLGYFVYRSTHALGKKPGPVPVQSSPASAPLSPAGAAVAVSSPARTWRVAGVDMTEVAGCFYSSVPDGYCSVLSHAGYPLSVPRSVCRSVCEAFGSKSYPLGFRPRVYADAERYATPAPARSFDAAVTARSDYVPTP